MKCDRWIIIVAIENTLTGEVYTLGKADTFAKDYLKQPEIFADVFNQYIFHGKQVIVPESLEEKDPTMIAVPYGIHDAAVPIQKYRDLMKMLSVMTDGKHIFCILGIEAQKHIHYAAPVKNGVYDFLQFAEQVTAASKSHRKKENVQKEEYEPSNDEYLSGFWKTDRLLPIITITLYLGREEWDGPLSLHEMYGNQDDVFLKYAPDYHVNLIAPSQMSDEQIDEFHTDLREMMLYIKYSADKEKLNEVVTSNPEFRHMDRKTVNLINEVTDSRLKYPEKEMKIDVCVALQEMREESEVKGKAIGIIQMCKKFNRTKEDAIECLYEECEINEDEALVFIDQYW